MNQMGIGAMIHWLGGGSEHDPKEYYGRIISAVAMEDDRLRISFADGKTIELWDNGQSCCEHRYMRTDDNLEALVGGKLARIEAKSSPNIEDGSEEHEVVFVEVGTDQAFITISNHNEHNGYYGGFGLTITERD